MPTSCVAVGCTNRHKKGSNIRFFRFPREEERRCLWLLKMKRDHWNPKEGDRICSDHFLSGKPHINPENPDYCPTVFVFSEGRHYKMERFKRKQRRELTQGIAVVEGVALGEDELPMDEEDSEMTPKYKEIGTQTENMEEIYLSEMKKLEMELEFLRKEKQELQSKLNKGNFSVKQLNERNVKFYTSLWNMKLFMWVVQLVLDGLPNVKSVAKVDQVFMTLMKLRFGLLNEDLALRFGVSSSTVSCILAMTIPLLANRLRFLIRWPSKDHVKKTLPKCFRKNYHNSRVIIDCSELFIERPLNLTTRAQTFSSYKQHNTVKFLIGITPYGAVSFLSECWGGRVSDKELTERPGFYDILEPSDLVMADRGFTISNEIAFHQAQLVIPPFTREKKQLPGNVIESARRLSSARIHVERAIERIKNFRILKYSLTPNLAQASSEIVSICACLINLQKKIISK